LAWAPTCSGLRRRGRWRSSAATHRTRSSCRPWPTSIRPNERFVSSSHGMAHDLRALLGIAFGFACNLRDDVVGPLNAEQREHVMRIVEACRDATALLERTKSSSRMPRGMSAGSIRPDSGRPSRPSRGQRTLVDLAELASSVQAMFEPTAEAERKTLACRTEPISVWGDA